MAPHNNFVRPVVGLRSWRSPPMPCGATGRPASGRLRRLPGEAHQPRRIGPHGSPLSCSSFRRRIALLASSFLNSISPGSWLVSFPRCWGGSCTATPELPAFPGVAVQLPPQQTVSFEKLMGPVYRLIQLDQLRPIPYTMSVRRTSWNPLWTIPCQNHPRCRL